MELLKERVIAIENRLIEGIKNSDTDFLGQILHNELRFLAPNGQMITKEMDLQSHRRKEMFVESLELTIEDIRIVDETAIAVVLYKTKGTMLSAPIDGLFRYIRIWKQFGEDLKVIGGSCVQVLS